MAEKSIPILLVTANVGSIFEDPTLMLKTWTEEFLSTVTKLEPKFIALHCQELGGKTYEVSTQHVDYFVRLLMSSEELRLFDKVRIFLDEDYSSAENFTALGNLYFIHESISDVLIWDFKDLQFVPVEEKEKHSGNIENISTKEKAKFPQDFFPECKWSRKGFLRTRWNLSGTVFDLINIHLFHDASNFVAMESFPSVYCKNRRRALEHTLDRFHNDKNGIAPYFLFGDFNFRTNTRAVVDKLAEGLDQVRENPEHTKLQYKDESSQIVFSVGKKEFNHQNHQAVFVENDTMWLKGYDNELEPFAGRLFEFPIHFPPTYPYEENDAGATCYMKTRCPSWCDRVILSSTAKSLVADPETVEYGPIGLKTCMGDHKPVYLRVRMITGAGTVFCCTPQLGKQNVSCFLPDDARAPSPWPCGKNTYLDTDHLFVPDTKTPVFLRSICSNSDVDGHLLVPPVPFLHEPYTPESIDTPSPSPIPSPVQLEILQDKIQERLDSFSKMNEDRNHRNNMNDFSNCGDFENYTFATLSGKTCHTHKVSYKSSTTYELRKFSSLDNLTCNKTRDSGAITFIRKCKSVNWLSKPNSYFTISSKENVKMDDKSKFKIKQCSYKDFSNICHEDVNVKPSDTHFYKPLKLASWNKHEESPKCNIVLQFDTVHSFPESIDKSYDTDTLISNNSETYLKVVENNRNFQREILNVDNDRETLLSQNADDRSTFNVSPATNSSLNESLHCCDTSNNDDISSSDRTLSCGEEEHLLKYDSDHHGSANKVLVNNREFKGGTVPNNTDRFSKAKSTSKSNFFSCCTII